LKKEGGHTQKSKNDELPSSFLTRVHFLLTRIFIRVLEFGVKVSLVGMFCGLFLMPVYANAPVSSETIGITDPIVVRFTFVLKVAFIVSCSYYISNNHIFLLISFLFLLLKKKSISISNVGAGDPRFIATAVAAYIVFGYSMYTMFYEFDCKYFGHDKTGDIVTQWMLTTCFHT
jgi:hypothetical protein